MPTRHTVRLSAAEAEALLSVVGLPLERVLVDAHPEHLPVPFAESDEEEHGPFWHVDLHFAGRTLELGPQDYETPTELHAYADVDRVRVVLDTDPPPADPGLDSQELEELGRESGAAESVMAPVAADLGVVRDVHVLATVAWFTPPEEAEPLVVGDVELGGDGIGYAMELAHPDDAETRAMLAAAEEARIDTGLVELDIGLRLDLDAGRSLTVATSGFALMVSADGPVPEDLRDVVELVPVRERLAGA